MAQEWAEAEDVADQQAEEQYNQGYRHNGQKLDSAIVGMKLRTVNHQESGQEEIVKQVNVQSSGTYEL